MSTTLEGLNPEQLKAATHLNGPLLILAGAGSGKTRVITNRIAWLIGEQDVKPWNICAITFTNKAAGEMRERVNRMVGFGNEAIHVATFHSTCVRILRMFIDRIGYERNFDIYDSDDQKTLMKDICKRMSIDTKIYKEKMFLSQISHQKDELIDPLFYRGMAEDEADRQMILIAQVYEEYQKRLKRANALDFDDLICLTVRLFRECPDVLDYYQEKWRFLMVDEYQDTNKAQFVFISLLAQKYRNLCVVGDDDQSIYRFRGADIGNILNFEKIFPDAEVIRLEQNYRSTQNILDAANAVITNNTGRKVKKLWTAAGEGDAIVLRRFEDARGESSYIADDIARQKRKGTFAYKDSAILYRTNAQSRAIEEQLLYENIPYSIIGGTNFYARREIKDILAYLKVIDNDKDDVSVKRIINVPKRGIGGTSISRADSYAQEHDLSFFDVCRMADKVPGMGRGGLKIREFVQLIEKMKRRAQEMTPTEIISMILKDTGYEAELKAEMTEEAQDRLENIRELSNKAAGFEKEYEERPQEEGQDADSSAGVTSERPTLRAFLEEVALVADIDSLDDSDDRVPLMTMHAAKGLEFGNVYLAGMDEGLFPSYRSMMSEDEMEIEEERRLCYVGITRAKKRLTLTGARTRMLHGQLEWFRESRFLEELPESVRRIGDRQKRTFSSARTWSSSGEYSGSASFSSGGASSVSGSSFASGGYAGSGGISSSAQTGNRSGRRSDRNQKPFFLQQSPSAAPGSAPAAGSVGDLGYEVGDRVRHAKFGEGVVQAIRDGGRDREVTVAFDAFGQKKMFAGFAKLTKV